MGKRHKLLQIGLILVLFLFVGTVVCVAEPNNNEPLVNGVYFDSDLREVLKEISMQTGVIINMDENIKGLVSMELKNVPLEKALQMLLCGGGFVFRKIDDFYVVGLPDPKNPTFPYLCRTEIYYFKNLGIDSAKALLPDIYKNYVRFDSEKNMVTINGPASIIEDIKSDLEKIDGVKKQIKIKALATEVRKDSLKELGFDVLNFSSKSNDVWAAGQLDIGAGVLSLERNGDFGSIFTKIKILNEEKKATIQADPVIVVSEGKTGQLFVGDKKTIILQATNTNSSNQTETVEAGITLKVTPRVFKDYLELTVSQKISGIEQEEKDRILVKTREFSSVVALAPGQTIMVAGLTEKKNRNNTLKTPLLGDIPIVGLFFKQKSTQKDDSELLIFLSAEVIP